MPAPTDQDTDDLDTSDASSGGSSDESGSGAGGDDASESSGSASDNAGDDAGKGDEGTEISLTLEGGDDENAANDAQRDEPAPAWVKGLRKENRDKDRRIRQLERDIANRSPAPAAIVAGPKPTLEGCAFDSDRFERELSDWMTRDGEAKRAQADQQRLQEDSQKNWQKRIADVNGAADRMSIAGGEDAREGFEGTLSVIQQAIVLNGPEDAKLSAQLRHAIGANPSVAKRLAAINDPVRFAFAVAELVPKMKINRKAAPSPERRLSSGAVGTAAVDNALEEARKRADKTGDRTEVARLMRQKQQRAA